MPLSSIHSAAPPADSVYTVYCLAEHSDKWRVRYIGITKQRLYKRLHGHLWDAKRQYRHDHKTNWIRRCISSKTPIRIRQLNCNLTLKVACINEISLISKYGSRLVNIHEGGTSGYTGLPASAKLRHKTSTRLAFAKIPMHVKLSSAKKANAALVAAAKARRAARMAPAFLRGGYKTDGILGNHDVKLFAPSNDAKTFCLLVDGTIKKARTLRSITNMMTKLVWSCI